MIYYILFRDYTAHHLLYLNNTWIIKYTAIIEPGFKIKYVLASWLTYLENITVQLMFKLRFNY